MPGELLGSASEFDSAKRTLGHWLRDRIPDARVLTLDELKRYEPKQFVAGWQVRIAKADNALLFDALVDGQFPYSPIRIAYRSDETFLRWPHVEPAGVLCLPRRAPPTSSIDGAIAVALEDACELVHQSSEPGFVEAEFQREFVSYWHQSVQVGATRARSLLDLTDQRSRLIAVWFGEKYIVVGETADAVNAWLKNWGRTEPNAITNGVFGFLDRPPTPPFPKTPREVLALLDARAPSVTPLLGRLSILEKATIVLAATAASRVGLIGMTISPPSNFDGFRKNQVAKLSTMRTLWTMKSTAQRMKVERVDAPWIHGRGMNRHQSKLAAATVVLAGCGSLGSQVGIRLAQSGVGGIVALDPDELSSANIGRHALGMGAVGINKAAALASILRSRFPHIRQVQHFPVSWQEQYSNDPTILEQATLVVACMGDWGGDGQLGEWQRRPGRPPVVYGWLDEHGSATHALALSNTGPALSCILDSAGFLRVPETRWEGEGVMQSEPACGTLYQPYGPIDAAVGEVLVSRLCIQLLAGELSPPRHHVSARSTAELQRAGGSWSDAHLKHRPPNFHGAFEYERAVTQCGDCPACQQAT